MWVRMETGRCLYSMTRWVKNGVQGHIVALTNCLTGEGRRWKPNDWLGP